MSKDTTADIHRMLAERYSGGEWAYLVEAPDGTGSKKQRTADAIAIGLWGKNSGEFHAFEVKSSRSDWVKELQDPEKSQSWRNVCASFWLVAGRSVAKIEEVPPAWGFLEVSRDGTCLKLRKQPVHTARPTVPLNVVGAILRRGIDILPPNAATKLRDVDAATTAAFNSGRELERKTAASLIRRNEELESAMQRLTTLLGRSPEYLKPDDLTVRLLKAAQKSGLSYMSSGMRNVAHRLKELRNMVEGLDERLTNAIDDLEKIEGMPTEEGVSA